MPSMSILQLKGLRILGVEWGWAGDKSASERPGFLVPVGDSFKATECRNGSV
jgi:hypothetical protein